MGWFDYIYPEQKDEWGNWTTSTSPTPVFIQFIPGEVIDVVTHGGGSSTKSAAYTEQRDVNSIIARPHFDSDIDNRSTEKTRYYPLMRGIIDVPTHGDQVLLCEFGGVNYYLGPLNTINNPNFNIDHLRTADPSMQRDGLNTSTSQADSVDTTSSHDKMGVSKSFKVIGMSRLQKVFNQILDNPDQTRDNIPELHGDMLLEGRHGNSLRIGSRDLYPNIVFSNKRLPMNYKESFADGSLLSITSKGSLFDHFSETGNQDSIIDPFVLASDSVDEPIYQIGNDNYNYEYNTDQIFLNSKKITINAYQDSICLSSFQNIVIGAGTDVNITSNFDIRFNASAIYIGGDTGSESVEVEPIVRGNKLADFLDKMLQLLVKTHGLVQGVPIPVTDSTGKPLLTDFQSLKNELASPDFLSDIAFIESENR
jgi:hypothetical protein